MAACICPEKVGVSNAMQYITRRKRGSGRCEDLSGLIEILILGTGNKKLHNPSSNKINRTYAGQWGVKTQLQASLSDNLDP